MKFREISSAASVRCLAVGALACGSAVGVASIDLATSPASGASLPKAQAAAAPKVVQVDQTMVLSVASIQGNTITAHGQEVTGQINGVVSFNLTLLNGSRVTANFTIYNNGHIGHQHRKGTVRGNTDGSYHVSGSASQFHGQILGIHGNEEFSQAKNLGINVSGTLDRRTYKLTAILKGKYVE